MVPPKPEVMSSRPLVGAFDTLRSAGVPESAFSAKVLALVARLKRSEDFVSWDDFLDLLDQGRRFVDDDEAFIGMFERFTGAEPEMKAFGSTPGLSPQAFCLAIFESFGAGSFPGMAAEHRALPDGSVELIFTLPEGFRDASSFFIGNGGALRTLTSRVGLPAPTRVDTEVSPRRAWFRLYFDAPKPAAPAEPPTHHEAMVEVIRRMRGHVERALHRNRQPSPEERVASLGQEWALTPRQTEVLRCVCRGMSNQDIALELGCARKTVELHVTEILRKAGLDRRAQLLSRFAGKE